MPVTFVITIACMITYPIYYGILVPLKLEYLQTIAFILIIAALVQFVEMALKKFMPSLHASLGVYLPLITTNCTAYRTCINRRLSCSNRFCKGITSGIAAATAVIAGVVINPAHMDVWDLAPAWQRASLTQSM